MVAKGEGFRGGMEWQVGVRRYKLYRMDCLSNISRIYINPIYIEYIHYIYIVYPLYIEWINKVLLYSTKNCTQYSVMVFPGGPVVKNPPANARDTSSVPGRGRSHMHGREQLSSCTTTIEPEL